MVLSMSKGTSPTLWNFFVQALIYLFCDIICKNNPNGSLRATFENVTSIQ